MRYAFKALTATALLLAASQGPAETPRGWDSLAAVTAAGNPVLGNQAAPVRLVEFVSYTCPHCANYDSEARAPLRSGLVRQGKVAVEVRPFLRNAVDISAALLALCGPDERFFANHDAILGSQERWFQRPAGTDLQARWSNPDFAARTKAIAVDLGLYSQMQALGYQPTELDRCLADEELAGKLAVDTRQAIDESGVSGTPSFLINGKLQTVHSWDELRPLLEKAAR
jgi:protein-disulfide isomerase